MNTRGDKIRVLMVEDDHLAAHGLEAYLNATDDITVVGICQIPEDVIQVAEKCNPDVIILDLHFTLSELNGFDVISNLRQSSLSGYRILAITAHHRADYYIRALEANVDGLFLKTSARGNIALAVRSVASGQIVYSPEVDAVLKDYGHFPKFAPGSEALTTQEQKVVELIAQGKSNHEIASNLTITVNTAKKHVSNILQKLNLRNRDEIRGYAALRRRDKTDS